MSNLSVSVSVRAVAFSLTALPALLFPAWVIAPDRVHPSSHVLTDPPPSGLRELWVISDDAMNPAERLLAGTLQGLVGRKQPRIWLRAGSMHAVIEAQLRREGVKMREAASVWDLMRPFR